MRALPNGVGPHEGREFDLMRQGDKHVALFFEIEPEGLGTILDEGFKLLEFNKFTHLESDYATRIVYRTSHKSQALRLKTLVTADVRGVDPPREHEIGKILGYSRAEVDAFIAHVLSK